MLVLTGKAVEADVLTALEVTPRNDIQQHILTKYKKDVRYQCLMKRSAIQPASNFYSRAEPDLFSNPPNMMDKRDPIRKDWSVFTPETPGPREDNMLDQFSVHTHDDVSVVLLAMS